MIYLYVYLSVTAVMAFVLLDELSGKDLIASLIAGLFWPVLLPARILRKILR